MKKVVKTNRELAEMLILELQHTLEEDYFTGKFLDEIENILK